MNVTWDQTDTPPGWAESSADEPVSEDEQLVALAQADPAQFAALYERYVDAVFAYALRRLRDRDVAADVTARVFTRALAALPSYRPRRRQSFRSWLFVIAHNTIVDAGQRRRDHLPLEPLDAAGRLREPSRGPEEHAIVADERARLHAALRQLPASQREVIELRLAGLTGPEIADTTGTSLSAVKSVQYRAYARLRELLGPPPADAGEDQ